MRLCQNERSYSEPDARNRSTAKPSVRVMHIACALAGHRAPRGAPWRGYGHGIAPKMLIVLQALLWRFHNARSGLCFPSYETIAEAAKCARSTVAAAVKALEAAGVLSWVNRLKRVIGPDGVRRVVRTSNGYAFHDPKGPDCRGLLPSPTFRREPDLKSFRLLLRRRRRPKSTARRSSEPRCCGGRRPATAG